MAGLLILLIVASTELTVDVERPLLPALGCVQAVLTSQGESIIRVDEERGVIMTRFRLVSREALQRIAATNRGGVTVRWTKGIYQFIITLSPVERGGTQVRVAARILGYSETSTPVLRPSPWRPLPSTGNLEARILAAVTASCRADP
jgi:hypothetical protein